MLEEFSRIPRYNLSTLLQKYIVLLTSLPILCPMQTLLMPESYPPPQMVSRYNLPLATSLSVDDHLCCSFKWPVSLICCFMLNNTCLGYHYGYIIYLLEKLFVFVCMHVCVWIRSASTSIRHTVYSHVNKTYEKS